MKPISLTKQQKHYLALRISVYYRSGMLIENACNGVFDTVDELTIGQRNCVKKLAITELKANSDWRY